MKKRVINIHGWEGYPDEGWRPWLKRKLEEKGFEVINPAMPDTKNPKLKKWLTHLNKIIKKPDKNLYLIGHSLGCITILKYLESLGSSNKIGGAILVAGFSKELTYKGYKNELSNFFQIPVNWNKVKKNCNKFIVLQSNDDPYVSINHAYILKEKLNAETIIQNGMKHYSGDDGITKLPIVLNILLKISKSKQ